MLLKRITISHETHRLFYEHAPDLSEETTIFHPDSVDIFISEDTHERLEAIRQPLETDDQLISRVLGRRPN